MLADLYAPEQRHGHVCDREVEVRWIGWRKAESRVSCVEAKVEVYCLLWSGRRCLSGFQGRFGVLQRAGLDSKGVR